MKGFLHRLVAYLGEFSLFQSKEREAEGALPLGKAALASLVCLIVVYSLTCRYVSLLSTPWAELLLYSLIPLAVAFRILYHSHWHNEQRKASRCGSVALLSLVALGGALLSIGIIVTLLAFLAIACRMGIGGR